MKNQYWGFERENGLGSCKDGSDLYRPIVKGIEPGRQPSQQQMWKTRPESEKEYNQWIKGKEEGANYRKDDTSGLWMIPQSDPFKVPSVKREDFEKGPEVDRKRKEEWAYFYSSDNYYVMDETTNLWMAPTTEETCKANDGFVCKVLRLDVCNEIMIKIAYNCN